VTKPGIFKRCFSFLIFIFSVLAKEIGWKDHLRNALFYLELDVKLNAVNQSLTHCLWPY